MSLKAFHILFITLSSLLSFGFGVWSLRLASTHSGWLIAGIGSLALGGLLVVYGVWFVGKLRRWDEEIAQKKTSRFPGLPGSGGRGPLPARHAGV